MACVLATKATGAVCYHLYLQPVGTSIHAVHDRWPLSARTDKWSRPQKYCMRKFFAGQNFCGAAITHETFQPWLHGTNLRHIIVIVIMCTLIVNNPIYTRPLIRIRKWIKLIQFGVNTMKLFRIQSTSGCGLNPDYI